MGGRAFMWHYTPRMPNDVYEFVAEDLAAKLRTKFSTVITPPVLPSKTDHGDIDFYVGGPLDGKLLGDEEMKELLGAIESSWNSFAVRWPEQFVARMPERPNNFKPWTMDTPAETDNANAIQVDLKQENDPMIAEWCAFTTSFSLEPIFISILRGCGLHHRSNGAVVRIDCLAKAITEGLLPGKDKRWPEVLITVDPSELLKFLGMLEEGQKWTDLKFTSDGELAFWICSKNRLFDIRQWERYQKDYEQDVKRYPDSEEYYDFFKTWVEVYIPQYMGMIESGAALPSVPHSGRAEVLEEVMSYFSDARDEITSRIDAAQQMYEPMEFFANLERELHVLITPEVFSHQAMWELNTAHYSIEDRATRDLLIRLTTVEYRADDPELDAAWVCPIVVPTSVEQLRRVEEEHLSDQNKAMLMDQVKARISCVVRRVKAKTVLFAAGDKLSQDPKLPIECRLWVGSKFDELLQLCVDNRRLLEEQQNATDRANLRAAQKRRGKKERLRVR